MRIGIEAFRIFRKNKHGMDIVAIEQIKRIQYLDRDNLYFIFCFKDYDNFLIEETENVKIIKLPQIPSPIAEQFLLPFLAIKYNLDILHSTGNTSPLFVHCRRIITLHDIIYLRKDINLKGGSIYQRIGNAYRRLIVPLVLPKASSIFTVSETEKEAITKTLPELKNKISVVYNACSSNFTAKPKQSTLSSKLKYGLPNEPYFLLHGNTDPKKNTKNTLIAFHQLLTKGKLKRRIVLTDLKATEVQKIIKQNNLDGLDEFLILTNYVNHEDMPDLYTQAFAFLYPSIRESFGLPIIEAMSCGTPVITSNSSCMPEIAKDAARFVDPFDPASIAEGIEEMEFNDHLRLQFIEKGLMRSKDFSWSASAKKLINLYRQTSLSKVKIDKENNESEYFSLGNHLKAS
ncbi:MAG: glycosyltransferase family 4 protein [Bacteroidia bacterium]|nr:glycosyltransferase family 4 protein [Bacteroidia bacterium]